MPAEATSNRRPQSGFKPRYKDAFFFPFNVETRVDWKISMAAPIKLCLKATSSRPTPPPPPPFSSSDVHICLSYCLPVCPIACLPDCLSVGLLAPCWRYLSLQQHHSPDTQTQLPVVCLCVFGDINIYDFRSLFSLFYDDTENLKCVFLFLFSSFFYNITRLFSLMVSAADSSSLNKTK